MKRFLYQGFLFAPKGSPPRRRRKKPFLGFSFGLGGSSPRKRGKITPPAFRPKAPITVEAELLHQTEKAVKVRDENNRICWIPKRWIVSMRDNGSGRRIIRIAKADWAKVKPLKPR